MELKTKIKKNRLKLKIIVSRKNIRLLLITVDSGILCYNFMHKILFHLFSVILTLLSFIFFIITYIFLLLPFSAKLSISLTVNIGNSAKVFNISTSCAVGLRAEGRLR